MKKQLLTALCAFSLILLPCNTNCIDNIYKNDGKLIACFAIPAIATYIATINEKNTVLSCFLVGATLHLAIRHLITQDYKAEKPFPEVHAPLKPLRYICETGLTIEKSLAEAKTPADAIKNGAIIAVPLAFVIKTLWN